MIRDIQEVCQQLVRPGVLSAEERAIAGAANGEHRGEQFEINECDNP
ncbi:MAG: hypothetical protein SFV23_01365 [Planctomycetaceae bacterium]|nr:hypothetical protein [Planctomycetaceae bacterium]